MTNMDTKERTVPRSLFNAVLIALLAVSGLAVYGFFFHHPVVVSDSPVRDGYTVHHTLSVRAEQSTAVASENNSSAKEPAATSRQSEPLATSKVKKEKTDKKDRMPAPVVVDDSDNSQAASPINEGSDAGKTVYETDSFDYFARYKVRGKAYFHNAPDESTKRAAFITHWNNAIIKPLDEQNGFIYIIFTNYEGQRSRGWLSKSDLIKVK